MYKFILFTLTLSLSTGANASTSAEECEIDSKTLGAKYQVSTLHGEEHHRKHINLWRHGNEVAHQHPETQITEIWNHIRNGQLRPVRYFDQHQRGIEYAPGEVNNGKGESDWSLKSQLVSDRLIQAMSLTKIENSGCDLSETYVLKKHDRELKLVWLPELKLVKTFTEKNLDTTTTWELNQVVMDEVEVKQMFTSRGRFQTTDFADIGDNESDPFLLQMINLGFVDHAASGIYDTQGNSLGGGSHGHAH